MISSERPDLILLDMNMPVMDGWEFCSQLKGRGAAFNGIPIIVMTAARDAASRWLGRLAPRGYLGKPFDLDHLFQTIDSLLATR